MTETNWSQAGATISDKTARDDYGLTQEQIIQAIYDDKLQYREMNMHGNPWFRLFRSEVEALVCEIHGDAYLKLRHLQCELTEVDAQLRKAKAQITSLNKRRTELLVALEGADLD